MNGKTAEKPALTITLLGTIPNTQGHACAIPSHCDFNLEVEWAGFAGDNTGRVWALPLGLWQLLGDDAIHPLVAVKPLRYAPERGAVDFDWYVHDATKHDIDPKRMEKVTAKSWAVIRTHNADTFVASVIAAMTTDGEWVLFREPRMKHQTDPTLAGPVEVL